jgi:hypothetical protein
MNQKHFKRNLLLIALGLCLSAMAMATPETCDSDPNEGPCQSPLLKYSYKDLRCPENTASSVCAYVLPPATIECGELLQGGVECVAGPISNPSLNYVWQSSDPIVVPLNVGGYFEVFTCNRFRVATFSVTVYDAFGHSQSASTQVACLRTRPGGNGSQQPQ